MKFISTRGGAAVPLEAAIMAGTAPDGGLYVPAKLPTFRPEDVPANASLATVAEHVLTPFFADSTLADELSSICAEAFNFPVPVRTVQGGPEALAVLELFHGPTAAFKDFGARFLATTMARIIRQGSSAPATIVVATSGDTGGAVAAAFHQQPGTRVVVLFPEGRVSPRQQHQLTCWGDNIISLAVKGKFDDCQRVAKSSVDALTERDEHSRYIVPTGNLGNGFACAWARSMGFPIAELVLATNANKTIPDYLSSGEWSPRSSQATLASAMDVGNPSNMERLRNLWGDAAELRKKLRAFTVSDAEIRAQLQAEYAASGDIWCPHTATGFHVYRDQLTAADRAAGRWTIAATAHAAKFETIVEPLLGCNVPVPAELEQLLEWPSHFETIAADKAEVLARL
jgi:threonine synthase